MASRRGPACNKLAIVTNYTIEAGTGMDLANRALLQEQGFEVDVYDACESARWGMEYIRQCRNEKIFTPPSDIIYPMPVRQFWRDAVRHGEGLKFVFNRRTYTVNLQTIAEAGGYHLTKPADCTLGDPTDFSNMPSLSEVNKQIAHGKLRARGSGVCKNTLRKRPLIFLDTVIRAAVHTQGHGRIRTGAFLHALFDAHHDRWFSVPALFLAGMLNFYKHIHFGKGKTTGHIHFPHMITAILQHQNFPFRQNEGGIIGFEAFAVVRWQQIWRASTPKKNKQSEIQTNVQIEYVEISDDEEEAPDTDLDDESDYAEEEGDVSDADMDDASTEAENYDIDTETTVPVLGTSRHKRHRGAESSAQGAADFTQAPDYQQMMKAQHRMEAQIAQLEVTTGIIQKDLLALCADIVQGMAAQRAENKEMYTALLAAIREGRTQQAPPPPSTEEHQEEEQQQQD